MTTPDAITVTEVLSSGDANFAQEWNHPDAPPEPKYDDTYPERLAQSAFEEAQRQGLAESVTSPPGVLDAAWPALVWLAARTRTQRLRGY